MSIAKSETFYNFLFLMLIRLITLNEMSLIISFKRINEIN